jgi:hypothetical protein
MDEVFWPEQVSVGEVLYPPGGSYGPRIQPTIELVWLIRGEMTVWIDGVPRSAAAGTVAILFPGHEERFAFSRSSETYHQWAHISVPTLPASIYARLTQLTWPLPLTLPMADLIRQALGLQTSGLSTTAAMGISATVAGRTTAQHRGSAALYSGAPVRTADGETDRRRRSAERITPDSFVSRAGGQAADGVCMGTAGRKGAGAAATLRPAHRPDRAAVRLSESLSLFAAHQTGDRADSAASAPTRLR